MIATARPPLSNEAGGPCSADLPSAPRLDAYAAVLSLDQPAPLTPGSAPVRLAIMDRNGADGFKEADLQALVAALPSATPPTRDWSRADLNGDGFTGGPGVTPFDLDPSGSTRAGAPLLNTVAQTIEGVSVPFDERNVSDVQALCFYAYSGLYTGNPDQRRALSTRCSAAGRRPSRRGQLQRHHRLRPRGDDHRDIWRRRDPRHLRRRRDHRGRRGRQDRRLGGERPYLRRRGQRHDRRRLGQRGQ